MRALEWREFSADGTQLSLAISSEEGESGFVAASRRVFMRNFTRRGRAERVLEELLLTDFLPTVLRFGPGKEYLLEMVLEVAESYVPESETYDKKLRSTSDVLVLLLLSGRVPSPSNFMRLWKFFDKPRSSEFLAEQDLSELIRALDEVNEWTLRELELRSGMMIDALDESPIFEKNFSRAKTCDNILRNYKQINKNILNDDFEEARQDHISRRFRYAPRSGKGGVHKQVKLTLHEDLLPVVKKAVGSGNRNAWIEQAIMEKLERDGFEFDSPDYVESAPTK